MAGSRGRKQSRAGSNNTEAQKQQGTHASASGVNTHALKHKSHHTGQHVQASTGNQRWQSVASTAPTSIDAGGSEPQQRSVLDDMPVGFLTPLGATSPDAVAPEAEPAPRPSRLRVAGFGGHAREEEIRWCQCEYEYVPAYCSAETPLGMAHEHSGRFGFYGWCSEEAMQQAVLVRGLPNELEPFLQVVLDQAGLKGQVIDWRFQQGAHCAEALILLPNQSIAERAASHFRGCCWSKFMEVSACLVETEVILEDSHAASESLTDRVLDALLAPPEEWLIDDYGHYIPAELCQPVQNEIEVDTAFTPTGSTEPLTTIFEEKCSDLIGTEGSTDAGASCTSVASEADDYQPEEDLKQAIEAQVSNFLDKFETGDIFADEESDEEQDLQGWQGDENPAEECP